MDRHYHTLDLVNGQAHTHMSYDALESYLTGTARQAQGLLLSVQNTQPGRSISSSFDRMRVTVCDCPALEADLS